MFTWFLGVAVAAECGPGGCPLPPVVADDGAPVAAKGRPPLDLRAPEHVAIATFALG